MELIGLHDRFNADAYRLPRMQGIGPIPFSASDLHRVFGRRRLWSIGCNSLVRWLKLLSEVATASSTKACTFSIMCRTIPASSALNATRFQTFRINGPTATGSSAPSNGRPSKRLRSIKLSNIVTRLSIAALSCEKSPLSFGPGMASVKSVAWRCWLKSRLARARNRAVSA